MSTRGFSLSVPMSGPGGVPLGGDFNIYLDVDPAVGDDANGGTSWADAFLTWVRAMNAAEQQIATSPSTEDIVIHVTNTSGAAIAAGSFSISPAMPDRSRIHVVCDFDRWAVFGGQTGTVAINGITAEIGSGLATVELAGFVATANAVGKTLRLTRPLLDPNVGEVLPLTILGLGLVANSYLVSTLNAAIPGFWDVAADTIANVIEAPNVLNGCLTFAPTAGPVVDTALFAPKNWLVGVRANAIIVAGEETAATMCECRAAAALVQDGPMVTSSSTGAVCEYINVATLGLDSFVSVAHARLWGIQGLNAFTGQNIGNAALGLQSFGGPGTRFSGYVTNDIDCVPMGSLLAERFRCRTLDASHGAQVVSRYFRVLGANDGQGATDPCIRASGDGTNLEAEDFALEELAGGAESIVLSENDARVEVKGINVCMLTVVPANYPIDGFVCDGARLEFTAGISDATSITINGRLIYADNMGEVECVGNINMVTARPGVGPVADILIDNGSKMIMRGNILKTVSNTIKSRCLHFDRGSKFEQPTGGLTHGAAPANWTANYGAIIGGYITADRGSTATFGTITDGAVGAGAGTGITARHGSSIWYGANSLMTSAGNTAAVVGVKAAAAFPGAAVLNDLVVGAGGVSGAEELCVIGQAV